MRWRPKVGIAQIRVLVKARPSWSFAAACSAHRIQVVQSDAWLADSQGIGRRRNLTRGHEGLEISN
jgi:hypothetical protein